VASDLILKEKVDLMLVSSTPDTTNPVSDQCESNGVPCISTVAPWQSWFFGRGAKPTTVYKWTYHFFWGLEDIEAVYSDMWQQVTTNKKIGGLWPNDSDGDAFAATTTGFPAIAKKLHYSVTDPGRYPDGTQDFTAQISRFKSADCDILTGVPIPPDFITFYKQAAQQGYSPKLVTLAKALLFPSTVEALGSLGDNLGSEVWWTPSHPFTSSLTGQSAKQLAAAFEAGTKTQWIQPIGFVHALFEVAYAAIAKAGGGHNASALINAIKSLSLNTIVGPVNWGAGPVPNVAKTPLVGGQWRKSSGGPYPFELVIVSNKEHPNIPAGGKVQVNA
jgi:branched-chain amino acid transport system substrate-binding protein